METNACEKYLNKELTFWAEPNNENPTLTNELVKTAECKLGVKLPGSFIELLKINNGGYTMGFVHPMNVPTSWAENFVPVSEIFGIVDVGRDEGETILVDADTLSSWGLP